MKIEYGRFLFALSLVFGTCTAIGAGSAGSIPDRWWLSLEPVSVEYQGVSFQKLFRMRITPARMAEWYATGAVDVRVWIAGDRPSVAELGETLRHLRTCSYGEAPGDVRGRLEMRLGKESVALYVGRFGKVYVDGQWLCTQEGEDWLRNWLMNAVADLCGGGRVGAIDEDVGRSP
ncbi:MAG: hypothetical protein Q9Q40_14470 [Acidobacteriota bacterium]|nr:hypothetical protein [Acidobacteriota bacterium]